jgi:hypothetical protein
MQALNVSRRTLARYKSTGKLTPITLNNKDLYAPKDIAHFSAQAESTQDKLTRQTHYNSHRVSQLELRISVLEALLDITPVTKLRLMDVDIDKLRVTLVKLCTMEGRDWSIDLVENLLGDISRMGEDVIDTLGTELITTCIASAIIHAKRLKHRKSQLLIARGEQLSTSLRARGAKYIGPRIGNLANNKRI